MQATNYPNHQSGATRNTLKKPTPQDLAANPGVGATGTGLTGTGGYPVDSTTATNTSQPPTSNNNNNTTTSTSFPPTTATSTSPEYPNIKQAKKEERVGKIETTVGKILHSSSMKAKGEVHLENAAAINMQHSSLTEAQRLEAEAKIHRERAEAHKLAADAITGSGGEQGPGRYDSARGA